MCRLQAKGLKSDMTDRYQLLQLPVVIADSGASIKSDANHVIHPGTDGASARRSPGVGRDVADRGGAPSVDEDAGPSAAVGSQASDSPTYRPHSPIYSVTNSVLCEFGFEHIADKLPDVELTDWQEVEIADGWKIFYPEVLQALPKVDCSTWGYTSIIKKYVSYSRT